MTKLVALLALFAACTSGDDADDPHVIVECGSLWTSSIPPPDEPYISCEQPCERSNGIDAEDPGPSCDVMNPIAPYDRCEFTFEWNGIQGCCQPIPSGTPEDPVSYNVKFLECI